MDNFYYILIKNNGDIIHNIFATSHKDLIGKYTTPEDARDKTYIKAMFSPKDGYRLDDVNNYQLIHCESYIPEWFTETFEIQILNNLKTIIDSMIIRNRKTLLLHEGAILVGNAVIDEIKHSVIFAMYDNAKIKILDCASQIHEMTDDTQIDEMHDNTNIINMNGFAKINKMFNYSKVFKMYGQAKVGIMYDHSRITILKGDASITEMYDESQAERLKHMSRIDEMHGHSVIEEMWDWTVVEKMFDQSRINTMNDYSIVLEMYGDSIIEQMYGQSVVERLCENSLVRKLNNRAQILRKELDK